MKFYLLVLSTFISIPAFATYTTCDFDGWTFQQEGKKVAYLTSCFISKPGNTVFCRKVIGKAAKVTEGARSQHIPYDWHHLTKEKCEENTGIQHMINAGYPHKIKNVMGVKLHRFELPQL